MLLRASYQTSKARDRGRPASVRDDAVDQTLQRRPRASEAEIGRRRNKKRPAEKRLAARIDEADHLGQGRADGRGLLVDPGAEEGAADDAAVVVDLAGEVVGPAPLVADRIELAQRLVGLIEEEAAGQASVAPVPSRITFCEAPKVTLAPVLCRVVPSRSVSVFPGASAPSPAELEMLMVP